MFMGFLSEEGKREELGSIQRVRKEFYLNSHDSFKIASKKSIMLELLTFEVFFSEEISSDGM
jgi:hypothetical protein